jgi:hypothetical protein
MLEYYISETVDILNIKKPIEIKFFTKIKKNSAAKYWALINTKGKLNRHLIHVYNILDTANSVRNISRLVIHELIHAWQEENGINEIHGPEFQKTASRLERALNIDNLYIPEIDKP